MASETRRSGFFTLAQCTAPKRVWRTKLNSSAQPPIVKNNIKFILF